MKINADIVKKAEEYVTQYLVVNLDKNFLFHNISHTTSVVKATEMLCNEIQIDKHDKRILLVAAWFHDLGYTQRIDEHEDIGAMLAEKFLKEQQVDDSDIVLVKNCIIATHYPQHPLSEKEMILCDADMIHLADKDYMQKTDSLRKEWAITRNKTYTDEEWIDINIKFLSNHFYHTRYCKDNLEERKNKNIKRLMTLHPEGEELVLYSDNNGMAVKKKNKKIKANGYGKGVETLFRIASTNHMRLSGMADNKAHILLSINSIIISVILSVLAKKLTEASYLLIPTALLLCVCLATIVFAVLTTRPKVSRKKFTLEQINNKEVNLMFFGNFHQLDADTYESGIKGLMKDDEYLYKTLTKDIYYVGKILAVKYRYLNIGYMIFMFGLIASVITYAISFFLY